MIFPKLMSGASAKSFKKRLLLERQKNIQGGFIRNVSSLTPLFISPANSFFKDRVQSKTLLF